MSAVAPRIERHPPCVPLYPAWRDSLSAAGCLRLGLIFLGLGAASPSWAQIASDSPEPAAAMAQMRQAEEFFQRGELDPAADRAAEAARLAERSPAILQRAAEILYLSGRTAESLPVFDRVVELVPDQAPYNWQRGIALCTAGRFADGAAQFKTHHDVNPDDVENSAWYFLCIAKTDGIAAARQTVIPSRGDGRQPMMSVLAMLQGRLEPAEVLEAAIENTSPGPARRRAEFYAALYVGLYYDALGQERQAIEFLKRSLETGSEGYMADTARVYLADRFQGKSTAKRQPSK